MLLQLNAAVEAFSGKQASAHSPHMKILPTLRATGKKDDNLHEYTDTDHDNANGHNGPFRQSYQRNGNNHREKGDQDSLKKGSQESNPLKSSLYRLLILILGFCHVLASQWFDALSKDIRNT